MAYDDSYPTSDSEIIIADCEPVNLNGQKDLDYINDWVDLTVENEIWRGKKLREEKPLPDKTHRECDVLNIDFMASFCNENQRRARKGCISKKDKIRPSTPRPTCPCARSICASSSYSHRISKSNSGRTTTKNLRKCSMRIAELAVPTKRQCIDTWRNKSYILPEFMVDRLKQHVMDQRPIVKIPEAIYCFRRQRPKLSKNCSASQNKKEIIDCKVLKPYNQMDTRTLCIIFGHKIAKILSNPLNLTLNSDLENLSNIVASDIAQMFSKPKYVSKQINTKHRQKESIHKDVSNKITVWIANILEDLSLKLLEEDLRVRKENEANSKIAEKFVTVMEKILQRKQCTDLEEEEGPVLDFIDDLVDNVMNICEPPPVQIDEESDTCDTSHDDIFGEESEKPLKPNESSENKIMTEYQNLNTDSENLTNEINSDKEHENLSDVAHFRNEIWDLIHNAKKDSWGNNNDNSIKEIEKENNNEMPAEVDVVDDDKIINNSINMIQNDEIEIDNDTTNVTQNDENTDKIDNDSTNVIQNDESTDKIYNDSTNIIQNDEIDNGTTNVMQNYENTGKIDDDSSNDVQNDQVLDTTNVMQNDEIGENNNPIDNAETNHSNVSEVFEIFTEDSDDEKSSKKVKFSVTDLVNSNQIAEEIKSSTMELPEIDEPDQINWNSNKDNVKSDIVFAEPNDHLLSDADESWPPELTERPILKVSNSVSKSVTSLGNILEKDEKEITPVESEAKMIDQQKTGDIGLQEKVIFTHHINQDTNTHLTEKYEIGSQTSQGSKEGFNESTIAASETTVTKEKSTTVKDINIDQSPQTFEDNPVDVDVFSKPKNHQTDLENSNTIKVEKTADIGGGPEGNVSQIDYSWKVHPKTAPSWVTSCGHGRGEPSEDSIPVHIKPTKVTESDLRKWCKDLEKAFINLEMWKNWIENTCKETIFLLKKKEIACAALNRKGATNWIRLKRNIHKDAILWTKLHLRTEDNFKILKRKYNNVQYTSNKASKSDVNKEIFQSMREFENVSVMLHEMIVTAEYCAMCTCNKTKTRKYMNMEEYLRNITE